MSIAPGFCRGVFFARFLKYSKKDSIDTIKKFLSDYAQTTKEIRAFYNKIIDILLRTAL